MKEATGELNMTVITVIAIAAVAALFYAFVWPMIQRTIVDRTCKTYGNYVATPAKDGGNKANGCIDANEIQNSNDEHTSTWYCCPASN